MNKFNLMNTVSISNLSNTQKCLLMELILRSDNDGRSFPSVQRLAMTAGIKHEKNFKGISHYLGDLVAIEKKGRKNFYVLNASAIMKLPPFETIIKHTDYPSSEGVSDQDSYDWTDDTPAPEGSNTPASADNTPSSADNTPAPEGANSSLNTSKNNTEDCTVEDLSTLSTSSISSVFHGANAPVLSSISSLALKDISSSLESKTSSLSASSQLTASHQDHIAEPQPTAAKSDVIIEETKKLSEGQIAYARKGRSFMDATLAYEGKYPVELYTREEYDRLIEEYRSYMPPRNDEEW